MEFYNLDERIIKLSNSKEKEIIENFLKSQDLNLDKDVEYTVAFFLEGKIIATGSFAGRVLKCIAVDSNYKGLGISNKVVSHLVNEEYTRGRTHLFIYTKPENYRMFNDMGFYKITEVSSRVVLLENDPNGIQKFLDGISIHKKEGRDISSIVMNCNPFTLGHKYLIEKASNLSDILHIFVVWEDKSIFPAEVRYKLVQEGTKHLSNVIVHRGKDYIISDATFPSYFMKETNNVVKTHALLDLRIFGQHIAPALDINKRFVGEEPYCLVTKAYNELMKEILPKYGIESVEIPRLAVANTAISASWVRGLIKAGDFSKVKEIVPKTTYDFLVSKDAEAIIKKIKNKI